VGVCWTKAPPPEPPPPPPPPHAVSKSKLTKPIVLLL
jgi:hypothetical protein